MHLFGICFLLYILKISAPNLLLQRVNTHTDGVNMRVTPLSEVKFA